MGLIVAQSLVCHEVIYTVLLTTVAKQTSYLETIENGKQNI